MLKLRTKTFKLPLDLQNDICKSFKNPLIFYLAHKNDNRAFFITFVILDFAEKEMTYVVSYLPENISAVEAHQQSDIFRIPNSNSTPHCTLQDKKNSPFLTFIEFSPYFFKVDSEKNALYVYFDDDFKKDSGESIGDFSPTVFKDEANSQYFYFYSRRINRSTGKNSFVLHKASLDLSQIENLHTKSLSNFIHSPHTVKKIGHYILTSHFLHCQIKHDKSGHIFEDSDAHALFVFKSLYEEFCKKKGIVFTESLFENKLGFSKTLKKLHSKPGFSDFCTSKGKYFLEICRRNQNYSFTPLPGLMTSLNLDNGEERTFETTKAAPAHFEIDSKTGDIFVSSHNFLGFGRLYFYGPAAIDRFRLENGTLVKISTFSHPTGYRFTSHKVFSYDGKTYICTFGQPNRLFFINAETMELEFFEDIEVDLLSSQSSINSFLNYFELESFVIKTIEVSADGKFIFFMSHDYIYFYSFPQKKIVQKIRYNEGTSPDGEIALSDFYKRTTHVNYLQ